MDTGMVLIKTDKGHEEIEKRTFHLGFKLRTALIMVDGESAVEALLEKIPGEGMTLLDELLRDGFVASAHGKSPGGSAQPSPGTTTGGSAGFDLESAKRDAVKIIESLLGPGGESMAIAIEGCRTRAEFAQQAERTRDILAKVAGPRKAADFWTKTGL